MVASNLVHTGSARRPSWDITRTQSCPLIEQLVLKCERWPHGQPDKSFRLIRNSTFFLFRNMSLTFPRFITLGCPARPLGKLPARGGCLRPTRSSLAWTVTHPLPGLLTPLPQLTGPRPHKLPPPHPRPPHGGLPALGLAGCQLPLCQVLCLTKSCTLSPPGLSLSLPFMASLSPPGCQHLPASLYLRLFFPPSLHLRIQQAHIERLLWARHFPEAGDAAVTCGPCVHETVHKKPAEAADYISQT